MKNTLALVLIVLGLVGCASLSFETIGDTANGYGELRWKDGEYHKGYYNNSMRHGYWGTKNRFRVLILCVR